MPLRPSLPLLAPLLALLCACSTPQSERIEVTLHGTQPVVALAFSHSGDRLFLAGADHLAYSLEGAARGPRLDVTLRQLAVAREHVYALAAGNAPSELWLYDLDGRCLSCSAEARLAGGEPVSLLAASADGSTVVAASAATGAVFRVNVGAPGAGARGVTLYQAPSPASLDGLVLSPDGGLLLVLRDAGDRDSRALGAVDVEAVDTATGELRWRHASTPAAAVAELYWPGGPAPLVGLGAPPPLQPLGQLDPATGALQVLNAEQRDMQLSHDAPPLVRTPDGRFLFGHEEAILMHGRGAGALGRYDLEAHRFTPLLAPAPFNALALSPDGERLAVSVGTAVDVYAVADLLEAPPLVR